MFGLLLPSGAFLDFSLNTTITLNLACPIFDPDSLNREWSYPLKISRTPSNERELRAGRIDTVLIGRRIPATLYIEGLPFENGIIKVTGASQEDISVVFQNAALAEREVLEKARLRELSIPVTITEPVALTIELLAEWGVLDGDALLTMRINGIIYAQPVNGAAGFIDIVNADHPGLISLLEQGSDYLAITMNPIDGVEALEVELAPDLTAGQEGRRIYFSVFNGNFNATYQRITNAYIEYDSEAESSAFRLPTIFAPQLYDGKNPSWSGLANRYGGDQYALSTLSNQEEGWEETLLPQPRVAILMEKIAAAAGLKLEGSLTTDPELRQLLLWNNRDLASFLGDYGPQLFYQLSSEFQPIDLPWVVYRPGFNLAEYGPDISALDMMKAFNFTFAHITLIKDGRLTQTPIRQLLQGKAEDYTNKVAPGYKVAYSPLPDYALDYDRQGDEQKITGQLERITESSAAEVTPYRSPMFSLFEQIRDEQGQRVRLPITQEVGRNSQFGTNQDPSRRFLFHRGLQPDAAGNFYPQAGHSRQGFTDQPTGAYSLNWEGPGGLIESWWRELLELLQHGRQDTRMVRLTVADLIKIKEWRTVRKYYKTEDGTAVGVIRNIRVKASKAGLELAQVTFQLEPS